MTVLVGVLFLLSGATSLLYQVAWVRMLSLFFGSDVYAAAITLSVFMGGLSLGSWIAGRFGDRLRRPLVAYGVIEICIGLYALAFPSLLAALGEAYVGVYRGYFESAPWIYHGFRSLVAAATLLVPTLLMGATLPLIVRQIARTEGELGARVGTFYAINTLGALCGTLLTGFWLLPWLGVSTAVEVALVVNATIGTIAIVVAMRGDLETETGGATAPSGPTKATPLSFSDDARRSALVAVALSGLAALALEVVWMRVLVQAFSATVYAFSIMLACFLLGIFGGSRLAGNVIDDHDDPVGLLMRLQIWLAGTVSLLAVAVYMVPSMFGALVWGLTGASGGAFGVSSIVAQFFVAVMLILVPTLLLGATFPTAVRIYTRDIEARASGTGAVYSANTAGSVLGSLLGGFVLLPTFGTKGSLLVIAGIFFVSGMQVHLAGRGRAEAADVARREVRIATGLAVVAVIVALLLPNQTVINYNLQKSTSPDLIYSGEGVTHRVDIVRNDVGNTIMMINGNIEADTSDVQRRHFILKAHLPLLLHPAPDRVAVVGLGLGITLAATERNPAAKTIRLVELSPHMVEAHSHIEDVTGGILHSPKIDLRIDDGRNFMAMSDETFDMITADPVHPRITGVGYLYTREYYESIRDRLEPGGIVTQWMPMYRISPEMFDVAFRTFAEVFPHGSFWYVRGHGLFVATREPMQIDWDHLARAFEHPAVKADLESIGIETPEELLGHLLMDEVHVARYLARNQDRRINTDDNALLEYYTPFEFLRRTDDIVPDLVEYAGWDIEKIVPGAPPEVVRNIRAEFDRRRSQIVPELSEALD